MKRFMLAVVSAALFLAPAGCGGTYHGRGCGSGCGYGGHGGGCNCGAPTDPSAAYVGYPYYTTRGPRDFLNGYPPSIGR